MNGKENIHTHTHTACFGVLCLNIKLDTVGQSSRCMCVHEWLLLKKKKKCWLEFCWVFRQVRFYPTSVLVQGFDIQATCLTFMHQIPYKSLLWAFTMSLDKDVSPKFFFFFEMNELCKLVRNIGCSSPYTLTVTLSLGLTDFCDW